MIRKLILPLALLAASTRPAVAQDTGPSGTEFSFATGLTAMPDAFSTQCGMGGDGGDAGGELGVAALRHLGRHFALQGDARVVNALHFIGGCKAVLPRVLIRYDESLNSQPLVTSTVRAAFEASAPFTTVRLTAGPGMVWGSPALPAGVFSVAASTRGTRARVFVELEQLQTRVRAREQHTGINEAPYSVPIVLHPIVRTLRLGVAWHGRG